VNNWIMIKFSKRGEGKVPVFPQVGDHVVNYLGQNPDRLTADQQNPLWDKIQDGMRPAYAPDLLRLGYEIAFKASAAGELLKKFGVVSPAQKTSEDQWTADEVWAIQCEPWSMPFFCPDINLPVERWWEATRDPHRISAPFLVPKGVTVNAGAMRLCDFAAMLSQQPETFPYMTPAPYQVGTTVHNPVMPVLPRIYVNPLEHYAPAYSQDGGDSSSSMGLTLFRYFYTSNKPATKK
jgi:hypothetical protein